MTNRSEMSETDIGAMAAEALELLGTGDQVTPMSSRYPGLGLADAYRVTTKLRQLREARGEHPIGRKIGFTNRTIWPEYDVYAPIWGHVYDTTVTSFADIGNRLSIASLSEPRIEPEIVFGFRSAPVPGMDERALLGCIEWIAHGFEIVQSIFPAWKFTPADTIVGYGLHGALMIGPRSPVAGNEDMWFSALTRFTIDLYRNGEFMGHGRGTDVLDGPLSALKHLNDLLASDPGNPPLGAGELVTTGTVTRAFPIAVGERWSTQPSGIPLAGIEVNFTA